MKKSFIVALSLAVAGICACAPAPQKVMIQEPTKTQLEEQKYQQEIVQDYLNFLHRAKQIMHIKRGKKYEDGQ